MELQDDFVRKLTHTGALASFSGLHDNAQKILEGVRVLRPENVYASIGLAVTKINAYQLDDAIMILQDWVLKVDPENLPAKCFLGLAFKHSDRESEGNQLLREVIQSASEEDINEKNMANDFLEEEIQTSRI
jgi:lipopolysaccharide biosynthesis regulator YciM